MFKLVIADEEGNTTIVPLVREEITIGREEGNTIQLTERNISRKHARLEIKADACVIFDLDSSNGIAVNGERMTDSYAIKPGDEIKIGDYALGIKIEEKRVSKQSQAAFPVTPKVSDENAKATLPSMKAPRLPRDSAPRAMQGLVSPARLVILRGQSGDTVAGWAPGAEYALKDGTMKLGRAEDLDIWINHPSISREHVSFELKDGRARVTDLSSSNGLIVNQQEMKESPLATGDVIELGEVVLKYIAPGDAYSYKDDPDAVRFVKPASGALRPMWWVFGGALLAAGAAYLFLQPGKQPQQPPPTQVTADLGQKPPNTPSMGDAERQQFQAFLSDAKLAISEGKIEAARDVLHRAKALDPRHPELVGLLGQVEMLAADQSNFVNGQRALGVGDFSAAYFAFASISKDSPLRNKAEVITAANRYASAQYALALKKFAAKDGQTTLAMVQDILMVDPLTDSLRTRVEELERKAQILVDRALVAGTPVNNRPDGSVATLTATPQRPVTPVRPAVRERPATHVTPEPRPNNQPETVPETSPVNRMQEARGCLANGDQACVVRVLSPPRTEQEFALLIETLKRMRRGSEAASYMRRYLSRFPSGSKASDYEAYLANQGQ